MRRVLPPFTTSQINESELRYESHLLDIHSLEFQVILAVDASSTSGTVFEIHLVHKVVACAIHGTHIFCLGIQFDLKDSMTSRRFSIFDCLKYLAIVEAVFQHVFCLIYVFKDMFR